jgi:hypothetical protein
LYYGEECSFFDGFVVWDCDFVFAVREEYMASFLVDYFEACFVEGF